MSLTKSFWMKLGGSVVLICGGYLLNTIFTEEAGMSNIVYFVIFIFAGLYLVFKKN